MKKLIKKNKTESLFLNNILISDNYTFNVEDVLYYVVIKRFYGSLIFTDYVYKLKTKRKLYKSRMGLSRYHYEDLNEKKNRASEELINIRNDINVKNEKLKLSSVSVEVSEIKNNEDDKISFDLTMEDSELSYKITDDDLLKFEDTEKEKYLLKVANKALKKVVKTNNFFSF